MATLPRGIRNNNPLNLRISNNAWLGKVKNNTDGAFEQFTTIEYGLRAAMLNIRTIVRRRRDKGLTTTVRNLVSTWAPNADGNNEAAYLLGLLRSDNIQPSDNVDYKDMHFLCRLVHAMAVVENGQPVPIGRITSAYLLAFGPDAPGSLPNNQVDTATP